jgi:hypothetical protein
MSLAGLRVHGPLLLEGDGVGMERKGRLKVRFRAAFVTFVAFYKERSESSGESRHAWSIAY